MMARAARILFLTRKSHHEFRAPFVGAPKLSDAASKRTCSKSRPRKAETRTCCRHGSSLFEDAANYAADAPVRRLHLLRALTALGGPAHPYVARRAQIPCLIHAGLPVEQVEIKVTRVQYEVPFRFETGGVSVSISVFHV